MGKKGGGNTGAMQAAQQQGEISEAQVAQQNYANRPDQFNPWGSLTWGTEEDIDPSTGLPVTRWTQSQNLSDDAQLLFDQQMGVVGGRSELAAGMNDRIRSEMGGAPDWGQFGNVHGLEFNPTELRGQAEDAAYGRATSRLDPQFQERSQQMEIDLRNKGLRPGDQAYDATMANFGRERTDAYEQARMGATGEGRTEAGQLYQQQMGQTEMANSLRDQQIQEYLAQRSFTLNEQNQLGEGQSLAELSQIAGG